MNALIAAAHKSLLKAKWIAHNKGNVCFFSLQSTYIDRRKIYTDYNYSFILKTPINPFLEYLSQFSQVIDFQRLLCYLSNNH